MKKRVGYLLGLLSVTFLTAAVAEEGNVNNLAEMRVTADVSPLQGSGVAIDKIAANIQTVSATQLEKAQSISLADYISRYLGSVTINEAQNNPLQPDIYYRGFVASPLMGLPQGLSVYVNGVRFNEPFGDSVNWDLIPKGAIDSMALYPGSNPVYGLNSLGGSLSIKTKTGFSFKNFKDKNATHHQLEVYGGSWDRHSEELTSGGNNGTLGYFVDVRHFAEEGWRDYSPSEAKQIFGTLSWQGERGSLDLTLAANDNDLRGNGAAPVQLLQQNRKAVFTHPDQTITRLFFSELAGDYWLNDNIQFSGNAYFRQNRLRTFNGDDSDYEECESRRNAGLLCVEENDGESVVMDINQQDVLASDAVIGATQNTSQTNMRSRGGSLQTVFAHDLFKHENNLTIGASYDYATVHFGSDTQLATLTDDRGTQGSGILVDESRVRLHSNTETVGVFMTDSFSITDKLTATVAGRYNHIHVEMQDKYINAEKTLNGSHIFDRLNPSVGLTYSITPHVGVYSSYSESARAPTPMELSCADPDAPCKLPNSFVADPPLKQVVAKTWEAGLRGDLNALLANKGSGQWNLGFFHSQNRNDIIFRRDADSDLISQGYFSNIGKTRRYGIEAETTLNLPHLLSAIDDWHFSTNYTYLNARFMNSFDGLNPLDHDEVSQVSAGDRIPGIPEHIFKAAISVDLWQKVSIGINGLYSGEQFFRGDEANTQAHLAGYWLFNATADYKINKNFTLFGRVDNIFGARYNSFGIYGQADEVLGDAYDDGRFVSPGAPRGAWIGVRLSL